ncbi:hypothetical protein D6779_06975 [Candidatus Parcubacteria bacterium]|nr:MAG: hypothetical protein D6779_06975 [Candidatus Parcubacteria bacterium]
MRRYRVNRNVAILAIVAAIAIIAGIIIARIQSPQMATRKGKACAPEKRLCPDGTLVARTGPDCTFALCPGAEEYAGWEAKLDGATGTSFRYPPRVGASYIHTAEWPPSVRLLDQQFSCAAGNDAMSRTRELALQGMRMCVTESAEGAAGSLYIRYTYQFPWEGRTAALEFSLQYLQCGNYDEPQRTECRRERAAFSVDALAAKMARSLHNLREER